MADLFPLVTEKGTAFGWTGRKKSDIERENLLRQQANQDALVSGDNEGALARWGPRIYGPGWTPPPSSVDDLGEAIRSMKPSTTVVNPDPDFKGPMVQPPSFDLGIDTKPREDTQAPPSLAESVFAPPYHPDRPERGGLNQATPFDVPGYPAASSLDMSGKLAVGDPDAQPRDVIPQYLRRPESIEADPARAPEPSPYAPGGARYEVPGMSFDDLLLEKPKQARAYMQNRKALSETEDTIAESEGRKATQAYIRARRGGVSEQEAYDQHGEAMEASQVGRKFLESVGARRKTEVEGRKLLVEERQRREAKAFIDQKVAELRRDTENPIAQQYADVLEAHGKDPKLAEQMVKMLEQQTKDRDAREKPIEIGGVGYRWGKNAAGEKALEVIPGQKLKPEKSKWEGITATELDAMIENPATSPEDRAIATRTAARAQARAEKTAAAAVPKPTAVTEKEQRERFVLTEALREAGDWVQRHPDWVGTKQAWLWAQAYDAPDALKGTAAWFARFPKGYDQFRASQGMFSAEKLNELAGAALTAGEVKRYGSFLPNVYTTRERFMASVETSLKMMEAATAYQIARESGASVPEAQAQARAAIKRVAEEHVKKYGDPEVETAPDKSVEGVSGRLNIPRRR